MHMLFGRSRSEVTKLTSRFALAALAIAAPFGITGAGCDGENPLDAICCTDFKPGTNMPEVDWGIEDAELNASFGVAIQAIGDFSGTATAMVTDLGTLCRNLAVELGSDPNAVTTSDPGEYASQWCSEAATQITSISGELSIVYQQPQCTLRLDVQAAWEASCDIEGGCDPRTIEARCTGDGALASSLASAIW